MSALAKLTNYDAHGNRWSLDGTVRLTPQYARGALPGQRRRAVGWIVFDTLGQRGVEVPTLEVAARHVMAYQARRPVYMWRPWERVEGRLVATAEHRGFTLTAFMVTVALRDVGGMHLVGYTIAEGGEEKHHEWLTDVKHPERRKAYVLAHASNGLTSLIRRRIEESL